MQVSTQSPFSNRAEPTSNYSNRYSQRRSPPKSPPKSNNGKKDENNVNNKKVRMDNENKQDSDDNQEIKLIDYSDDNVEKEDNSHDQIESEEELPHILESKEENPSSERKERNEVNTETNMETNQSFGAPVENENIKEKEAEEDEILEELKALANDIPAQRCQTSPNKNRPSSRSYMRNSYNASKSNYTQNTRNISPNAVTVEEFQEYYEIFCTAFIKKRDDELERKRRLKEDKELAELQDKPTINPRPQTRQHIPLLDRTPILNARRDREIEKMRKEKEEKLKKELEELTFHPKINPRSKELVSPTRDYLKNGRLYSRPSKGSPNSARRNKKGLFKPTINEHSRFMAESYKDRYPDDVVDRLYHQFDVIQSKKDELARKLAPNFTPCLNNKTKKIMRKTEKSPHNYIYTEYDISEEENNVDNDEEYDQLGARCETEPVRIPRKETARFGNYQDTEEAEDDNMRQNNSDVELLGILKQFNTMLKQKNENPINLQQLGSLMANYAEKRKLERIAEQKKLEKQAKEKEAQNQEFSEVENILEPSYQREEKEFLHILPNKASEKEKKSYSSPEGKVLSDKKTSPQKVLKYKPETQNNQENKYQERLNLFDISSGSKPSSPNKSGDLASQLISNPRSRSRNDDPPVTSMNPELIQKALGDSYNSPQKTAHGKKISSSGNKSDKKGQGDTYGESPNFKGMRDSSLYSPATPSKKTSNKKISFKEAGATPTKTKGTASTKKEKNSSNKKNKSPVNGINKKDSTASPKKATKGAKSKSEKKKKGSKGEIEEEMKEEKVYYEKFTQTSKKSKTNGSDLSSHIVDSKNALEGWVHSNRELKEYGEEDLFVREQSEERALGHYNVQNEEFNHIEKDQSYSQKSKKQESIEQERESKSRNLSNTGSLKNNLSKNIEEENVTKSEQNSSNPQQKVRNRAQTDNVVHEHRQSRFGAGRKRGYSEQKEGKVQNEPGSLNKLQGDKSRKSSVHKGSISSIKNVHQTEEKEKNFTEENILEDHPQEVAEVDNDSIDPDPDSHDDSSTIGQNEENIKIEDVNVSFSANHNEKSVYTEHQAPQNEFNSSKTGSRRTNNSHTKSRRPPRPENHVFNTEIIQVYPSAKQEYNYLMDRSDINISSASSRGLKAIAEHIVKKFKAYDAQMRKGREFNVSVSPPRSGSHSPDTYENYKNNKAQKQYGEQKNLFRTIQAHEVSVKENAPKKQRMSLQGNLNTSQLSNGSVKKVKTQKRSTVTSGPVSRYTGGK